MPEGTARPESHGPSQAGDDLRDVSAELSAVLAELARAPEAEVDVSLGWKPRLAPGDVVGRFELRRELGRGGFGVVWEALDRELGRAVAFKAVRPGRRLAGRREEWLRAEAEAVARLNHPNIVTLHDFGRGPSGPYLIFELLRGETLHQRLRAGALPLRDALRIGIDVARVLAHAHRAGVVHRDLKPGNVFLCEDGGVKVLDFGLAFLFGRGGPVSGGTPSYMAPEQWRAEPGDERTDLFALGVLLHQMISGAVPYRVEGDRSEAVEPGPVPQLAKDRAPARLRRLVAALLEKDPAARPQSAQGVLDALLGVERALEGKGRRRRELWASALVGLAVAGAFALRSARRELPGEGEKLVVAVADFQNGTGERDLDGLSGLLATSLEQSRRFQVLTRSRQLALLRQMGRSDAARIDEALARELARAAGARVVLVGSARRVDGTYALELKALDPAADRFLFSVRETAPAKAELLPALDRLSDEARHELHERGDEVRRARIRVAQALTSNVEAYQAYFEGVDCMERPSKGGSWITYDAACAAYFREALSVDPTFALAHHQLSVLLWNVNSSDPDAITHLSAAVRYADRLPAKENLLIRAWKDHVEGRDDEALATYASVLADHPLEKQALSISGDVHFEHGELEAAIPFFEKLLSLDPEDEWPLDSLVSALGALRRRDELSALLSRIGAGRPSAVASHAMVRGLVWLGDPDGAVEAARSYAARAPGGATASDLVGALSAAGRTREAEVEARRATEASPAAHARWYSVAGLAGQQGRYAEGLRILDEVSERVPAAERGEVQFVRAMYVAGYADPADRWREAAKARALAPELAGDLAIALALQGDLRHAASLADLLPRGSTAAEEYAAVAAWRGGDAAGGAARLAALDARDPWPTRGFAPSYLLAEASAGQRDWRGVLAAVSRFRSLWPRGIWRSWAVPRTFYLAALGHAGLGDRDAALGELERLARLWEHADPGLPLVQRARDLRAKLSQ